MKIKKQNLLAPLFLALTLQTSFSFADAPYSALHFEVIKNDPLKAVQLIQQDPASISVLDRDGLTPLHLAIKKNNYAVLDAMLDDGLNINPNIKSKDGETPLLYAVKMNNSKAAQMLLKKDVDCFAQDSYGKDSFYYAKENKDSDLEKALMDKVNQQNKIVKTSSIQKADPLLSEQNAEENQKLNRNFIVEKNVSNDTELSPVQKSLMGNKVQEINDSNNTQQNPVLINTVSNPTIPNIAPSESNSDWGDLKNQLVEKDKEIANLKKQINELKQAQISYGLSTGAEKEDDENAVLFNEPNKKTLGEVEQAAVVLNGYSEIKDANTSKSETVIAKTVSENSQNKAIEKKKNIADTQILQGDKKENTTQISTSQKLLNIVNTFLFIFILSILLAFVFFGRKIYKKVKGVPSKSVLRTNNPDLTNQLKINKDIKIKEILKKQQEKREKTDDR